MSSPDDQRVREVVDRVKCLDRRFVVSGPDSSYRWTVHVEYLERDVTSTDDLVPPTLQRSRRWILESFFSEEEIVETCFACICRSYAHVAGEHFTYRGMRVHSPHIPLAERMRICDDLQMRGKL